METNNDLSPAHQTEAHRTGAHRTGAHRTGAHRTGAHRTGAHPSHTYRDLLLRSLGAQVEESPASSNTGAEEECSILHCADGALDALRQLSSSSLLEGSRGAELLTERASILGLGNPSQISANGSCQLMPAADGWLALNLARQEDWTLIPAWLETDKPAGDWRSINELVSARAVSDLVDRGRLIGLPVSPYLNRSGEADHWFTRRVAAMPAVGGEPSPVSMKKTSPLSKKKTSPLSKEKTSPLVIDLSSLWAGPLCSHLLCHAGATVVKVESSSRPDSSRWSSPHFYDLLNAGKDSVTINLNDEEAIAKLKRLLQRADIVIESSRPRALRQLGIDADEMVSRTPGLTWVSITGYGRNQPQSNWVAFGDDAAVAAGAVVITDSGPNFLGDALSDPLTGIHAALVALSAWQTGVASLIDISLVGVTSFVMNFVASTSPIELEAGAKTRTPDGEARSLGADTDRILKIMDESFC